MGDGYNINSLNKISNQLLYCIIKQAVNLKFGLQFTYMFIYVHLET